MIYVSTPSRSRATSWASGNRPKPGWTTAPRSWSPTPPGWRRAAPRPGSPRPAASTCWSLRSCPRWPRTSPPPWPSRDYEQTSRPIHRTPLSLSPHHPLLRYDPSHTGSLLYDPWPLQALPQTPSRIKKKLKSEVILHPTPLQTSLICSLQYGLLFLASLCLGSSVREGLTVLWLYSEKKHHIPHCAWG